MSHPHSTEPENPLTPGDTKQTGGGKVVDALFTGLVEYDPTRPIPAKRCWKATDICAEEEPALEVPPAGHHRSACHHTEEQHLLAG